MGKVRAEGVIPTGFAGLTGGIGGAWVGWWGSNAYVETHPQPGSLADIGFVLFFTPLAGLLGAGMGVWALLRILGHPRAGVSGILFPLFLAAAVPAIAGVGSILLPMDIGIFPAGVMLTALLASLLTAIAVRFVVRRRGSTTADSASHSRGLH